MACVILKKSKNYKVNTLPIYIHIYRIVMNYDYIKTIVFLIWNTKKNHDFIICVQIKRNHQHNYFRVKIMQFLGNS